MLLFLVFFVPLQTCSRTQTKNSLAVPFPKMTFIGSTLKTAASLFALYKGLHWEICNFVEKHGTNVRC